MMLVDLDTHKYLDTLKEPVGQLLNAALAEVGKENACAVHQLQIKLQMDP